MFTGLIEATAGVKKRSDSTLVIERPAAFDDIKTGSSICVSGCCLTVTELDDASMSFDLLEETLKRTTIGSWDEGHQVNLERALKAGDRLDGHIVQGHIDGVGSVMLRDGPPCHPEEPERSEGVSKDAGGPPQHDTVLKISYPPSLRGKIVEKGSIAVDGVSLTVVSIDDESFSVALIPETKKGTGLGDLEVGERVNVEGDVMGKYAE
jgi:riboflavin synthase